MPSHWYFGLQKNHRTSLLAGVIILLRMKPSIYLPHKFQNKIAITA